MTAVSQNDNDIKIEIVGQHEIQLEAEIGRGSNSKVFKARWRNTPVAVKRFYDKVDINEKKEKKYIDNYATKVRKQPHENVIKILAISHKPFTLLTEYMNKGSVKNYIARSRPGSTSVSTLDRIQITLQAAKGLNHLHKLGIVHSKITCSHLLMELNGSSNSNDMRIVISGYGMQQMSNNQSALKWMAPELIENSNANATFASDIYAFGITMWEIITGEEPYSNIDPVDTAIHVLVKERRPYLPEFISKEIQNLMQSCWHTNINERPTAQQVVETLTQIVQLETKQNNENDDYKDGNDNQVLLAKNDFEISEQKLEKVNDECDETTVETISHNEYMLEAEIGRGRNSKVFKGTWKDIQVAVKRFTGLTVNETKAKEYIDNCVMKVNKQSHENVIKILAVAQKPFTLLMEYMKQGSVKDYIRHNRPGSAYITILDRVKIALQAAQGVNHLHMLGVICGEIRCKNLLMELKSTHDNDKMNNYNIYNINDIRVVITDYAIDTMLSGDELETYKSSLGALKWKAPELIENNDTKSTFESDIYAFGITMWEIITGEEPYSNIDPVDTAIHVLVNEMRPELHEFIPKDIQDLMKLCWHKNMKQRPTAQQVVQKLTQFVQFKTKQNNDNDQD